MNKKWQNSKLLESFIHINAHALAQARKHIQIPAQMIVVFTNVYTCWKHIYSLLYRCSLLSLIFSVQQNWCTNLLFCKIKYVCLCVARSASVNAYILTLPYPTRPIDYAILYSAVVYIWRANVAYAKSYNDRSWVVLYRITNARVALATATDSALFALRCFQLYIAKFGSTLVPNLSFGVCLFNCFFFSVCSYGEFCWPLIYIVIKQQRTEN